MKEAVKKQRRLFQITHFFNRDGRVIRNILRVDDSLPYRDEDGFVKEGRIILRLLDEDGSSRAFRLSIPEALELAKLLEIASDE